MADDDGDDDDSYYRQPSKYDYSSYASSSRKRSRSRRRKACRHDCKKSKRYKPYKSERRKKALPNKAKDSSDSSSDDEFQLDRSELQAALKRNTSSTHSSTLKRKLIGVSKTVEEFIKAKEDVEAEDISDSIEIMNLLKKINTETIEPESKTSISEEATESGLNEQELRIIALRSAILKKAEVRKKRKIFETQPYSPTDTDIVMENVITMKSAISKPKDELDNMEISPAVSPTIEDGSLQPIDMELESDDESQRTPMTIDQQEMNSLLPLSIDNISSKDLQKTIIVPDETSLSTANVPEESNQIKSPLVSAQQQQRKQQEEEEEQALRASLLAGLKVSKRGTPSNKPQPIQKPLENSVPLDRSSDTSVEMEQLRKQVFSSIQKRRNLHRHLLPNPFAQKFSVQVPKPMEMTMPQITSNLKEALKRIKERDKQIIQADAASNENGMQVDVAKVNRTWNSVLETAKVQVNKCKKVQTESKEPKNTAVKLNGDNVSIKATTNDPTITTKKVSELTSKTNEVLKTVTCNNSSTLELTSKTNEVLKTVTSNNSSPVECKTKDATVPLVISNKIDAGSLEKSDTALRSLKTVALKKAIEPHISLNQKENQQLRKIGVSPKRVSDEKIAIAKKAKINTAKISRVITTPVEKTVQKMIIQLNNSDTESDDFGLGQNIEPVVNGKSYSGVASPASHSFSPASPTNLIESKSSNTTSTTNDSFQQKLDEYLKSARTKVDQTKQETKPLKKSPSVSDTKLYILFLTDVKLKNCLYFKVGQSSTTFFSTGIQKTHKSNGLARKTKVAENE